jgi:asparagine synthase (glutamine-hydrolysing)
LRRAGTGIEGHYRGVVKGLSLETRLALGGPERLRKSERRLGDVFGSYFRNVEGASALNGMLYADAKVWLPDDLLLKADKMTMATAVELRVPFLDHKLVEFLAFLPDSLKIQQRKGKWILRQAMGSVLPPSILHRSKKGFPSPAAAWFRFELKDFVRDTLLARNAACRQLFDPQAIENIVERQENGKFSGFQETWSLLVFEFWHKQFIEEFKPAHVPEECAVEVESGHGA